MTTKIKVKLCYGVFSDGQMLQFSVGNGGDMRDLNAFCLNMTPSANCVPYCSSDPRPLVILWSSVLVCISLYDYLFCKN